MLSPLAAAAAAKVGHIQKVGRTFLPTLIIISCIIPHVLWPHYIFNSDFALTGLMAKHIWEGKDFPVYLWGQNYMGALEAYLAAPLLHYLGFKVQILNILPQLFSLLLPMIFYLFLRAYYPEKIARRSVLLASFIPVSIAAKFFYTNPNLIETTLIGFGVLTLYRARISASSKGLMIGVLLGIGFWLHLLEIYFAFTLAVLMIRDAYYTPQNRQILGRFLLFILLGALIGLAPTEYYVWKGSATNIVQQMTSTQFKGSFHRLKILYDVLQFRWLHIEDSNLVLWMLSVPARLSLLLASGYWLRSLYRMLRGRELDVLTILAMVQVAVWLTSPAIEDIGHFRYVPSLYFCLIVFFVRLVDEVSPRLNELTGLNERWSIALLAMPLAATALIANWSLPWKPTRLYLEVAQVMKSWQIEYGISEFYWISYDLTFYSGETRKISSMATPREPDRQYLSQALKEKRILYISMVPRAGTITLKGVRYRIGEEREVFSSLDSRNLYLLQLEKL